MPAPTRILIVDGDARFAHSLAELLRGWGHACEHAGHPDAALDALADGAGRAQVLITEMHLPGVGGAELLRRVAERAPDVVPLVLTGYGKIAGAVEAMKLGAVDYLTKPVVPQALRDAVERAAARHALLDGSGPETDAPDAGNTSAAAAPRGMVGADPAMDPLYRGIAAAAATEGPVLITGEPGTGKDLAARAVHAAGRAGDGHALAAHACSADPDADAPDWPALWAAAGRGTLLLHGVDQLPPTHAKHLLAWLRTDDALHTEARLIATAEPGVEKRLPRPLLDRLAGVRLRVPALRARPADLEPLTQHLLKRAAGRARRERLLTPAARQALAQHAWPGNVRELARALEHAVAVSATTAITPDDLPDAVTGGSTAATPAPAATPGDASAVIPALAGGWTPTPLSEAMLAPERRVIQAALEAHGWNRNAAARDLKIDRTTLYKKIKRFGLDRPGG